MLCLVTVVSNSATPWTVACQVPLSMEFFKARILECVAISFSNTMLLLDPATGELQLSRDLDNNRPLEALMEVSVSGEWPQGPRGAPPSPWGAAGGCQEPPGKPAHLWAGPGRLYGDLWP